MPIAHTDSSIPAGLLLASKYFLVLINANTDANRTHRRANRLTDNYRAHRHRTCNLQPTAHTHVIVSAIREVFCMLLLPTPFMHDTVAYTDACFTFSFSL